ncbi:unnamed protein product [Coffea canephora]|uniref:DH200=94 genomic scaffold, scaffold_630 n=1 Tax=Coffea canephora TaxID=49390 RepID=A0A068VGL7_COFCA|nr:unnamed protein product [Coffea canephora]
MELPNFDYWKQLWDKWELRAFIVISLSLQTFLILFAPLRKRASTGFLIMAVWSAYLLADSAAIFAVGLISNSQGNSRPHKDRDDDADLLAFWAPFLLVHLGGPDTITAFALEDNELWLRHLLGLVFHLGRFKDSMLTEPDPGPDYAKLMDEYYSKKEAKLPTRIQMIGESGRGNKASRVKEGPLTDLDVVLYAHQFFRTFRGLFVDLIFSFRERNQSRDFFLKRTADDAFRVLEVELNFYYDVFFTKVSVMYTNLGCIGRFVSVVCTVVALGLFYSERKKRKFNGFDVGITYTLLYGAIALDVIAIIMLIFSDSAVEKFIGYIGLANILNQMKYVKTVPFSTELRDLIFRELKKKSDMADDLDTAKDISSARGDWILRLEGFGELLPYISQMDYDQSLLLWHIATELCYSDEAKASSPNKDRDFSKLLSDYMLYLLVMQPTMMSAVTGIGQIRFRDTCAEVKKFRGKLKKKKEEPNVIQVIYKWEIMSKVWVELLSYAAIHCRASAHAQQLSKGGELITFVWLLMAHFGLGDQFQISEGHARAKLIVGK